MHKWSNRTMRILVADLQQGQLAASTKKGDETLGVYQGTLHYRVGEREVVQFQKNADEEERVRVQCRIGESRRNWGRRWRLLEEYQG